MPPDDKSSVPPRPDPILGPTFQFVLDTDVTTMRFEGGLGAVKKLHRVLADFIAAHEAGQRGVGPTVRGVTKNLTASGPFILKG
jgi:hypothetical protein